VVTGLLISRCMELPAIDSPQTPGTPDSPADITIQREGCPVQPFSFSDCQELARTVRQCSQSLIEGSWVDISDVRGRKPRFIPNNFESAKAFLRASVNKIPETHHIISRSDTPVTSHPKGHSSMGVCHECHGPIGGGAHQGSALGKGICTFVHSHFCKGGIPENESWAACPLGYIYNQDLDLASGTGFESTMGLSNFQPGPASSTPASDPTLFPHVSPHLIPGPVATLAPPVPHHGMQAIGDRYPGMAAAGDWRRIGREFPTSDPDTRVPGMVSFNDGAGAPSHVPETIQDRIDSHRAENQNGRLVTDRPIGDLDINVLRRNPSLQFGVDNIMESVIRK
jgi:hypothetical protein